MSPSPPLIVPPSIVTGPGSLAQLPKYVVELSARKVLLVTGRTFCREIGLTKRIITDLVLSGCSTACFERVGPEPDLATCDAARKMLTDEACDVVTAVGGGSVLDVGKVTAGLAGESAPTVTFWNGQPPTRPGVPFVAVPTTSGSGSEVTTNGVVTNPDVPTKKSIRDKSFLARIAIVDPELTLSGPRDVTAHSGMDALCQAVESFTSRHATAVTDAVAARAVRLIADGLEDAYRKPENLRARMAAALGALFAGISMANARVGVVHGLAHPLGARFAIPHGRLCAILLPVAMRLNRPFAQEKFRKLDMLLKGDADAFVRRLLDKFAIPTTLDEYAIDPEQFDAIIADALQSGSTKANPKTITAEDCRDILGQVCT